MTLIKQLLSFIMTYLFNPRKKDVDINSLGVNSFFNQPGLGSMEEQAEDIINNLNIKDLRILVQWNDFSQPSRLDDVEHSFVDEIISNCPDEARLTLVLAGDPTWLFEIHDEQRTRYFIRFCKKIIEYYKDEDKVIAYQIGNEPNDPYINGNRNLGFSDPNVYLKTLAEVYKISKDINPNKLILSAATTSIVQNYPKTLKYNKHLIDNGIEKFCDVFCIHYYGDRDFINLSRPWGSLYFLQDIKKEIWITEIGEKDFNEHLNYAKIMIPFLQKKVPNIKKLFWYQYDGSGTTETFGLRNSSGALSKLYIYLTNFVN